jgi:hypothetical protein
MRPSLRGARRSVPTWWIFPSQVTEVDLPMPVRHSITWLEYSPSRRRTAPFSPVAATSYSATMSSLYCTVKLPSASLLGHLRIGPFLPLAAHPSSIAGHEGTVELGHGHLRDISIPALKGSQWLLRGGCLTTSLAERASARAIYRSLAACG